MLDIPCVSGQRAAEEVHGGQSMRRSLLLMSSNVGVLAGMLSGTDDPTTVLNSVLGGPPSPASICLMVCKTHSIIAMLPHLGPRYNTEDHIVCS